MYICYQSKVASLISSHLVWGLHGGSQMRDYRSKCQSLKTTQLIQYNICLRESSFQKLFSRRLIHKYQKGYRGENNVGNKIMCTAQNTALWASHRKTSYFLKMVVHSPTSCLTCCLGANTQLSASHWPKIYPFSHSFEPVFNCCRSVEIALTRAGIDKEAGIFTRSYQNGQV